MARRKLEWVTRQTARGIWNVYPVGKPWANEWFRTREEADAYMANPPKEKGVRINIPGLEGLGRRLGGR